MARAKTNKDTKSNEMEYLDQLKGALLQLNLGVAENMLRDLKDKERCTPNLYSACIKFLSHNEITYERLAVESQGNGELDSALLALSAEYENMLLEYNIES